MIDPNDDQIIRPRELVIGLAFVTCVVLLIGVVLALHGFSENGDSSGLPTPSPSPSPVPTGTPAPTAAPGSESGSSAASPSSGESTPLGDAEVRLTQLARDSVELLPAGRWPELYDQFTQPFRDRCSREEFEAAGVEGANAVGSNLGLLGFVRLENLVITGNTASATIVGEVRGQSEYTVDVAYAIEDGIWKLAPAAGTSGCSAFNRTSG